MISFNRRYTTIYNKFEEIAKDIEVFEEKMIFKELKEEDKRQLIKKLAELKYNIESLSNRVKGIHIPQEGGTKE